MITKTKTKTKMHPKILNLRLRSTPYSYGPGIGHLTQTQLKEIETRVAKRQKEGQTTAYFVIWGVRNDRGEGFLKGSMAKSINERGPKSGAKQKIVVCYWHDLTDPIGKPTDIVEDDLGAYVVFTWADEEKVPTAKRAKSLIEDGILNGWSFGFDHIWDKMEYDEDTDTIWHKEVELYEISPVTFGADQNTFTVRSKKDFKNEKLRLDELTVTVLSGLPRTKQLEIRQLLTRHISLAKVEPDKLQALDKSKLKPLDKTKPKLSLAIRLANKIKQTT